MLCMCGQKYINLEKGIERLAISLFSSASAALDTLAEIAS